MGSLLTVDEAAAACGVSRDTIKRRLRARAFPGAVKGPAIGARAAPWRIPVEDLAAAGLRPVSVRMPAELSDDPDELKAAVAQYEALAQAREAHLVDLRGELRRLHSDLEAAFSLLRAALGPDRARDCAAECTPDVRALPTTDGGHDEPQEEGQDDE